MLCVIRMSSAGQTVVDRRMNLNRNWRYEEESMGDDELREKCESYDA